MEKICDLLRQGFLDIFSIFALGSKKKSTPVVQYIFLVVNTSVVLTILGVYVSKGSLFVSSDALSKAMDVFELLAPILIHVVVIWNFAFHQKKFDEMSAMMETFDKTFKVLNPKYFQEMKATSTFWFSLKFLCVHILGVGIDTYMLIR